MLPAHGCLVTGIAEQNIINPNHLMKKILTLIAAATLIATASKSMADWGLWDSDRSWIAINNQGTTNWSSVWNGGTGTFNGQALGTFTSGQTLDLNAYDIKSWKNGGSDVSGGTLSWTVYETGNRTNLTWNTVNLGFISDLGSGNQKWGFGPTNISILAAPIVSFSGSNNYTFEFYAAVNGLSPDGTAYDNNNNAPSNYSATFATVPEPSTYALLALSATGVAGYVIRRRRR